MMTVRWLACAAVLVGACRLVWGEPAANPPVIAVVGTGQERQSPQLQAMQEGLVHLVQSEVASRSGARVVSRRQAALFLDELGMSAAELTESGTGQRFGQALSADYLVLLRLLGGGRLAAEVTADRVAVAEKVWTATVTGTTSDLPLLAATIADSVIGALRLPAAEAPSPAGGPTPTLAVLDFRSEGVAGALDQHLADLADLLSANLTALGAPLVERQRLSAVLEELGLSASGLVRVADMARAGRLLGAERILDTSMIVSGQTVMFDSQLIQPETGLVVGSCRVSSDTQHVPAAVQQLATKAAGVLRVPVTDAGRRALAQQATGSLEAALHAAGGWRLGLAGQAEDAVNEYRQAVYLDPSAVRWWLQLGSQHQALGDNEHYAEAMQRFLALSEARADREELSQVACALADAEIWLGHAAESEAAARLALSYHENQRGYYRLIHALAEQRKFREARRFCESLVGREDVPHYQLVRAWDFLLGWFANLVRDDPRDEEIRQELDNVSRALDLFEDRDEEADLYLGVQLANALLACSTGSTPDALDLDGRGTYLEECLALARRMTTEYGHGTSIPGRGWFVTAVLEYKLGHHDAAIAALQHCLSEYPGVNFDSGGLRTRVGPASGFLHYLLGRTYERQGRQWDAIAAYRRAVMMLDSGRSEAQDALRRLHMLGAQQLPPALWNRRVGGAGRPVEAEQRQRLAHWLRAHGYDLRDERLTTDSAPSQELIAQGIQVLVWEGRLSDHPSPEQLRSYVAGGGNLLICPSSQPYVDVHGPVLATSSQTMDLTLSWLLPAFGMAMSNRAIRAEAALIEASGPDPVVALGESAHYTGTYFPLHVQPTMSLVTIRHATDTQDPGVVTAAARVGLGKIAVVSLRDWFPGADTNPERDPWQYGLLASILDWFAKDELPQRHPAVAEHWAAARSLVAMGDYGAAVQKLDSAEEDAPSAADARYWAGCLLADNLGDVDGAARRWREVIAARDADTWLVRMAHLRLGIAAVRAGDERTASAELALAAGEQPDGIWGQAWVAAGDLKLAQGDYLGAAQAFRKVADELGHTEERFRALFGLAHALGKQGKPEAATQVYDAIVVEFGKARLPQDMEARWPDPWQVYYPPDTRADEPTVADAVAAARLQ